MGERKVLNKYYPPDFDPAKMYLAKLARPKWCEVRMMLPFSIQCETCGEYMYRGKKFNSRKEDVVGEDYKGIKKYRFYIKCVTCNAEISFKTDPERGDYEPEFGCSRNFEPWREDDAVKEQREKARAEAEKGDAMKVLENKTKESKREMDLLDALDEMRAINVRHERVDTSQLLKNLDGRESSAGAAQLNDEDEALVAAAFPKFQPPAAAPAASAASTESADASTAGSAATATTAGSGPRVSAADGTLSGPTTITSAADVAIKTEKKKKKKKKSSKTKQEAQADAENGVGEGEAVADGGLAGTVAEDGGEILEVVDLGVGFGMGGVVKEETEAGGGGGGASDLLVSDEAGSKLKDEGAAAKAGSGATPQVVFAVKKVPLKKKRGLGGEGDKKKKKKKKTEGEAKKSAGGGALSLLGGYGSTGSEDN